jgi:hypothetical protein
MKREEMGEREREEMEGDGEIDREKKEKFILWICVL